MVPLVALAALLSSHLVAASSPSGFDAGINLPPMQGTSGTGAFMPGIYNYSYALSQVNEVRKLNFSSIRLPINIDTANDNTSLHTLLGYVQVLGGRAVLCMFGTANASTPDHGTGRVDDLGATTRAWSNVHRLFAPFAEVKYELLNEPYGYTNGTEYYETMLAIIDGAQLPKERCIIAGLSWETGALELARMGWPGLIGFHIYPWHLPAGSQSQEGYAALLLRSVDGISSRVYITEFGCNLDLPNSDSSDANFLAGIEQALLTLKNRGNSVKGVFSWHGWNNGDTFDFWAPSNKNGSLKVLSIMQNVFSNIPLVVHESLVV